MVAIAQNGANKHRFATASKRVCVNSKFYTLELRAY